MRICFQLTIMVSSILIAYSCCEHAVVVKSEISEQDPFRMCYGTEGTDDWLSVGLWGIPIPIDYDGDGLKDILVSCPDTPFTGLYYFRNIGTKTLPFFDKAIRISDIGKKNIRLSECLGRLHVISEGVEFCEFSTELYAKARNIKYEGDVLGRGYGRSRSNIWNYVDWEGDGDADIVVGIDTWDDYGWDNAYDKNGNWINGPLHGYVYLLENIGGGKYINRGKVEAGGKIIDTYGAPAPCIADFDLDGDLDIICGEFRDRLTWFENIGTRQAPLYGDGQELSNINGNIRFHIEMISPVVSDFDDDGYPDLLVGDEDGRIAWVRNSGDVQENGMPLFENPRYLRQRSDAIKFGALSTPFVTDWDRDGRLDILTGNSAGELAFIRNISDKDGIMKWEMPRLFEVNGKTYRVMAGENGSIQGPAECKWGYTVLSVADWDGDGLDDIIVNSIWGKVEWLRNKGYDGYLELEAPKPVEVSWNAMDNKPEWNWWTPEPGTFVTQWRTTPYAMDWNKDGLCDLITLDKDGYLSYYERFRDDSGKLLLKSGKRIFYCMNGSVYDNKKGIVDHTPGILRLNAGEAGKSGRRKISFADWDMDGRLDLLVDSKNVAFFRNVEEKNGVVILEYKGDINELKLAGHSTCPAPADIDSDGVIEIIVGAEDGHFYKIEP